MKFIFIGLAVLHGLVLTTVSTQQIKVRSHGDKQIKAQKQDIKERTYEAVLGLNVSPRNRLRVRTRNPKDATDTLAAAEAAGIKAKEIRQKNRLSYRDLDSFETSLIPVYYSNGASPSSTSVKPPRLPGFRQAFTQTTTPAPLVASTAASSEYVPTSSYGVPPVQIADEDIRPRGTSGKRPPVFGYYPPAQRVMPRVNHMEAECSDDVMKLRVKFNDTFEGLIYSAGYSYDTDCIYINGTGVNEYEFYIQLNRCGTLGGSDHNKKRDAKYKNTEPTKNYMWNTVTIQYNPLIEEEWDEHFKVTCEYGYDFWKTVTFPFLDVEVNTADPVHFTLTPPECHMEIRNGYGTTGARVAGPVHVGDPLTLMILMRSAWDGFDIVVNDCFAHNGANKRIPLIDHHGCPVDEKLISRFQGTWGMTNNQYDTLVYAHMKTFRFTGTPALYIECDIRMCHGKCPVQSCNWRTPKTSKKRARRETNELNAEDLKLLNKSLSESVNLFQSIHVLQSKEDELAFGNETSAEPLYDEVDSICVGSVVFAGVIGSMAFVALMSSVIVSLLCLKMKRLKDTEASVDNQLNTKDVGVRRAAFIPGSGANSIASLETLRSRATIKSEYVHSAQARIP